MGGIVAMVFACSNYVRSDSRRDRLPNSPEGEAHRSDWRRQKDHIDGHAAEAEVSPGLNFNAALRYIGFRCVQRKALRGSQPETYLPQACRDDLADHSVLALGAIDRETGQLIATSQAWWSVRLRGRLD
jgi:hypothetical protein